MNGTTQPWAVVMQLRDGSTVEQVFATRFQAETFLYLLPLLMTTQPDGDDVASAILSPLNLASERFKPVNPLRKMGTFSPHRLDPNSLSDQ